MAPKFCSGCRALRAKVARLGGELAEAKGLPTDSEICQRCGSAVALVWHASDEDWEKVVGGPGGLRCASCFAAEAREKGIHLAFLAVPLKDGWTEPQQERCRLEGCNAALEAALRALRAHIEDEDGGWDYLEEGGTIDSFPMELWIDALAALSDEGKGWPEVREQVRLVVSTFNEMLKTKEPYEEIVGAMDTLLDNLGAALAALGGKGKAL